MKRVLAVLAAVAVAISLSSCGKKQAAQEGPNSSKKTVKVGFITSSIGGFWLYAKAGVRQAEKDFNAQCEFKMPTEPTATKQKDLIQDLLSKGVSGIAISPMDPKNMTEMLNEAAKKVPLICEDSDAPDSRRICYIGTDNYKAGLEVGRQMMKAIPNGGKVMIFVGSLDAGNAKDRIRGVIDAAYPGVGKKVEPRFIVSSGKYKFLGVRTDNLDWIRAKSNAEDTLVKNPDIAAMVGIWGPNGPSCAQAVKAAGKVGKVKIISFDEEIDALQAIKDGIVECTVAQNPYKMGYEAVRVLTALARGEDAKIPANKYIDTGYTVVTRENVHQFWARLIEMKKQK